MTLTSKPSKIKYSLCERSKLTFLIQGDKQLLREFLTAYGYLPHEMTVPCYQRKNSLSCSWRSAPRYNHNALKHGETTAEVKAFKQEIRSAINRSKTLTKELG